MNTVAEANTPMIPVSESERLYQVFMHGQQQGYKRQQQCIEAAVKYDAGKPRYDLIPPEALDGLACLYGMGAEKYDARNWEKGMTFGRVFRAMMSHAWKWWRGERHDTDDGQHHLLSAIWCAIALYTYECRGKGTDDRPEIQEWNPTFWRSKKSK